MISINSHTMYSRSYYPYPGKNTDKTTHFIQIYNKIDR